MSLSLSDAQAQRLIKLYAEAEKEILTEINRLLLKDPAAKGYSMAWQKTLLQRVKQIRADLEKGSRDWCKDAIPKSYMQGVEWADKDPLAGKELMAGFGSIHQQAVQVLSDNAFNRLDSVNQVVGRNVDDIIRSVSLEATKGSVIGYKTTRQAAKQIRQNLADKGITGFTDKSGRAWDMGRYTKMLAQETTNGAFRQGTINRLEEKGHDLIRISTHTGACPKCQPWQGRTLSLSGNDPDYPSLAEAQGAGLLHVGCLHVLSLAPEEKERYIASLAERAAAIRNS